MAWRVTAIRHELRDGWHPDATRVMGEAHRNVLPALGAQRWMSESSLMMQIEPSSAGVASV